MRHRLGRLLVAFGLATLAWASLAVPPSFAAEIRTFADDFSNKSYAANHGTHPWAGSWSEAPIHNGANQGNIVISNSGSACDGCLVLGEPLALIDSSISRSADLTGATGARLDIHYRTDGEDAETAVVRLTVAEGSHSRTLGTFPLSNDDDSWLSASFDISDHLGPATTIRFAIVGIGLTDAVLRIDDVTITATFDGPTTTVPGSVPTTTTPPPSTTTTTPTSTTTTIAPPPPTAPTTTTTTTRPSPTTTSTNPTDDAGTATTTTTVIVMPTDDPGYATDKAVLVSSNEGAAMAVTQPMGVMAAANTPQSIRTVTFVNAAESVRSTAVYGVGVGLLLAGFLLVGIDDEDPDRHRRRRREE